MEKFRQIVKWLCIVMHWLANIFGWKSGEQNPENQKPEDEKPGDNTPQE